MRIDFLVTLMTYGIIPAIALAGSIPIPNADAMEVVDVLNNTGGPNSEISAMSSNDDICPGLIYEGSPATTVGQ